MIHFHDSIFLVNKLDRPTCLVVFLSFVFLIFVLGEVSIF